ncbi:MAG: glycoside hydrolase family 15 protein [Bdellovibrio sp.]|nr:glycoside hydrolase family 15 protein [Bdellovibrio sp.]
MYPYGLVGNCQISALISKKGSIDWLCLPRPDSDPVFGRLLDVDGGHFSISLATHDVDVTTQYYLANTNILITEIRGSNNERFRITDFCPRFEQYGRMFRPMSLFRIVEPISGSPFIRVSCKPITGWKKDEAKFIRGNSHVRFEFREDNLRLTTNMPLTYLCEESPFALKEKLYFGLTWSSAIEEDLIQVCERFFQHTQDYWKTWVKHCSIPSLFQAETIRSALALKLHCYEDTGAILAALTTSLPEEPGVERNWDYRYCWLRDAHFLLSAFHNLGHFEEMEGFLKFFLGIAQKFEISKDRLAPVYTLSQGLPLPEIRHSIWRGYNGYGPVQTNNQAAEHVQNDVYGEMVLTLAPIYFDERFVHLRTKDHENLLANLARNCACSISQPDAGLWEVRSGWQEHSFTNLMNWAGLERTLRIQNNGHLKLSQFNAKDAQDQAFAAVEKAAREGSIRNGPNDTSFDSALSLATILRFPREKLCLATVRDIQKHLALGTSRPQSSFFYRYIRNDDFGKPSSAFVICSFWLAQALARLGYKKEASDILEDAIQASNHLGLFSEHYRPHSRTQLGNFPQAYSHVGLINAAFAVSPPWSEIL